MPELSCQLSAYPDYLNARMGFDFSRRYHTDPVYRNEKWKDVLRWMHSQFGHWGVGASDPADSYSVSTLDSVHMLAWLFGANIVYSPDKFPAIEEYPLADIPDLAEFRAGHDHVDERLQSLLDDTRRLIDRFGPENVAVPFYANEDTGMADLETTHCPLTVAYRLFGTRALMEIFDNPAGFEQALRGITQLLKEVGSSFRQVAGIEDPENVCVGACAAMFLGPNHFRRFLTPTIRDYVAGRPLLFHSCGRVNHLLEAFGEMAQSCDVKVMDCREQAEIDLAGVSKAFPEAKISCMLSPPACLSRTPAEIRAAVHAAVEKSGDRPLHLILALPAGTADNLADPFFETCTELGAECPEEAGFSFV